MSLFPYNYHQWRNYNKFYYYGKTNDISYCGNNNYKHNPNQVYKEQYLETTLCSYQSKNNVTNFFEAQQKYDTRSNHYNNWHHPFGVRFIFDKFAMI